MSSRTKRITTAIALLLAFGMAQIYLPVGLANLTDLSISPASSPQAAAVLTTARSQPISVNGVNAITGATIMTGATIETPGQIAATVNLPGHFSLEIDGDAKVILEFDENSVKVTVIRGCVELNTKRGTSGEVVNEMGQSLGKTDPSEKNDEVEFCTRRAGGVPGATSGAATTGGSSAVTTFAIVGAAAADAALAYFIVTGTRGDNPSPSTP